MLAFCNNNKMESMGTSILCTIHLLIFISRSSGVHAPRPFYTMMMRLVSLATMWRPCTASVVSVRKWSLQEREIDMSNASFKVG